MSTDECQHLSHLIKQSESLTHIVTEDLLLVDWSLWLVNWQDAGYCRCLMLQVQCRIIIYLFHLSQMRTKKTAVKKTRKLRKKRTVKCILPQKDHEPETPENTFTLIFLFFNWRHNKDVKVNSVSCDSLNREKYHISEESCSLIGCQLWGFQLTLT